MTSSRINFNSNINHRYDPYLSKSENTNGRRRKRDADTALTLYKGKADTEVKFKKSEKAYIKKNYIQDGGDIIESIKLKTKAILNDILNPRGNFKSSEVSPGTVRRINDIKGEEQSSVRKVIENFKYKNCNIENGYSSEFKKFIEDALKEMPEGKQKIGISILNKIFNIDINLLK